MSTLTDGPIRLFVGSSPTHTVQEIMFLRSARQHASLPLEISIIDATNGQLRRINPDGTTESLPLPKGWHGRIDLGGTGFTYARFAPPELCEFEGRAIYCEADQLMLADLAELWGQQLEGASCAVVTESSMRGHRHEAQTGGHLSSVVVFDASRCTGLDALDICEATMNGELDFADAFSMNEPYLQRTGLTVTQLPAKWNDHEELFPDTALLHFTKFDTRPGHARKHPANRFWIKEYLACIDEGLLDDKTLDTALELGELSIRVRTLPRVPRIAVTPIDTVWQFAEPYLPRVGAFLTTSRRRVRMFARGIRRPLNRKRRAAQASLLAAANRRRHQRESDGSHNE